MTRGKTLQKQFEQLKVKSKLRMDNNIIIAYNKLLDEALTDLMQLETDTATAKQVLNIQDKPINEVASIVSSHIISLEKHTRSLRKLLGMKMKDVSYGKV